MRLIILKQLYFKILNLQIKKVQINQEVELTVKRNRETGELFLSDFSLDNLDFIGRVSIPLYALFGYTGKYVNYREKWG